MNYIIILKLIYVCGYIHLLSGQVKELITILYFLLLVSLFPNKG